MSLCINRVFHYQSIKITEELASTELIQNLRAMQGRKWHKVRWKKAENRERNSNKLLGRKTFYWKFVPQKAFEIIVRSLQRSLTAAEHGIPYVLESPMSIAAWKIRDAGIFQNIRNSIRCSCQICLSTLFTVSYYAYLAFIKY